MASTDDQDAVATIEAYLRALNDRDFEAAAALFALGALAVPTGAGSTTLETSADAIEYVRTPSDCDHDLVDTRQDGEFVFAAAATSS